MQAMAADSLSLSAVRTGSEVSAWLGFLNTLFLKKKICSWCTDQPSSCALKASSMLTSCVLDSHTIPAVQRSLLHPAHVM